MAQLDDEALTELREDFAFNDANADGRLNFEEFVQLLENLDAGMSYDEARIGFDLIDADRDHAIEFDEFVGWWTND